MLFAFTYFSRVGRPRVARGACGAVRGLAMCRVGEGLAVREVGPRVRTAARPVDVAAHWNGPAPAGCRCSTSTIAVARAWGAFPWGECGAVSPCPREIAKTSGCRSTGRHGCMGRGCVRCDVSESGRGQRGPGPTVRRVRGDVMHHERAAGRAEPVECAEERGASGSGRARARAEGRWAWVQTRPERVYRGLGAEAFAGCTN